MSQSIYLVVVLTFVFIITRSCPEVAYLLRFDVTGFEWRAFQRGSRDL